MWYWYLVGYTLTGFIAICGSAVLFITRTPIRNGYDRLDWIERINDIFDEVKNSKIQMRGALRTVIADFVWPIKLAWIIRDIYPEIIERYEKLRNLENYKED